MQSSDLKVGSVFEMGGAIYTAVECQHIQQPRLASFIRAKIKNIETGQVLEKRFTTSERLGDVVIERKEMQYLYNDGGLYYFMDTETYEQIPLDYDVVKNTLQYIVENMMVKLSYANGKIISIEPPLFVDLRIVECEPAVAGDTAKSAYKPAKVESGLLVKVPLFVNNGELIRVDTRTGEYVERVKG